MLFTIIIFIAVLAILVLVHELGHFYTALKFGCKVEEFGFGFPPRFFSWTSKKTGIEYSLNWIPLGGFVRIKGENGDGVGETDSFISKKAWQRAIILAAGVAMNVVLAAVLLSIGFMIGLPTILPENSAELANAKVRQEQIQIYSVSPKSPAELAGLKGGDQLLTINEVAVTDISQVQNILSNQDNQTANLTVKRENEELKIAVAPEYVAEIGRSGIGIGLVKSGLVSYPWYLAIWKGIWATGSLLVAIVVAFYSIIKNLIVGAPVGMDVSGPVGIAVLTGQMARMGFIYILQFTAMLSVNLAIINFLPLPALDGGRVLFLIIEKIRRRPVNQNIENAVHNVGFALLMLLVVFITYRDVVRFGGGLWQKMFG